MLRQRGFAALLPLILYGLAAVAIISAVGYGVHVYNEWVRAPQYKIIAAQKSELDRLSADIEANKVKAAAILAEETAKTEAAKATLDAGIKAAKEKIDVEKAKSERLRTLLDATKLYDRDAPGCRNGSDSPAGNAPALAGATEPARAGGELSEPLTRLLRDSIQDQVVTIAQYQFCVSYARLLWNALPAPAP